jgi:hypothetical protein
MSQTKKGGYHMGLTEMAMDLWNELNLARQGDGTYVPDIVGTVAGTDHLVTLPVGLEFTFRRVGHAVFVTARPVQWDLPDHTDALKVSLPSDHGALTDDEGGTGTLWGEDRNGDEFATSGVLIGGRMNFNSEGRGYRDSKFRLAFWYIAKSP